MKKDSLFIIIVFAVIFLIVIFFPKIYNMFERENLPKLDNKQEVVEEKRVVDNELLESLHRPLMRSSSYNSNTYYNLNTFKISNMSNQDILYNAFLDIEKINIIDSNEWGSCTNIRKEIGSKKIELRIKNILGKNINYSLENFTVPEDSVSEYKGDWTYNGYTSKFIYNGLCNKVKSSTNYYDLEQFIKAEYNNNDIDVYYYVGFAKVDSNEYTIYKDVNMTIELQKGTFTSLDDLNNIFNSINNKDKNIYKYTFRNTLCSYNEYCVYEGKWVNEL
jgi:hypothetical protein